MSLTLNFGDPRLPLRFWNKVDTNIQPGCWIWTGAVQTRGYGHMYWEGKVKYVHRLTWYIVNGEATEDIDHTCHNQSGCQLTGKECLHRRCVRLTHLEDVSRRVNQLRSPTSVAAANIRKTHCPAGHPFAGGNLYVAPKTGHRGCRACRKSQMEIYYRQKKLKQR